MKLHLETSLKINSSADELWNVLSATEKYPEWNPFIKSFKGELKVGEQVEVQLENMKFTPVILYCEENKSFSWLGHLWVKGLFDGEHYFNIEENKDGSCTFVHGERFNGVLVRVFKKKLLTETKLGFERMNQKLKERVENKG